MNLHFLQQNTLFYVVTDEPDWVREHLVADDIVFIGNLFQSTDAMEESQITGKRIPISTF